MGAFTNLSTRNTNVFHFFCSLHKDLLVTAENAVAVLTVFHHNSPRQKTHKQRTIRHSPRRQPVKLHIHEQMGKWLYLTRGGGKKITQYLWSLTRINNSLMSCPAERSLVSVMPMYSWKLWSNSSSHLK